MAGLLDVFNSEQGRMGLGLLGGGFGQQLRQGVESMDAYKKQQMIAQLQQLQMQRAQAEMADAQEQRKAQAAQLIEQQRLQELFRNAGAPAPNMEDAATAAMPQKIDYNALRQKGMPAAMLEQLAKLQELGTPEVARTVKGMQNGREVEQQYDKFGRPVGQGMEQFKAPISVRRGDSEDLIDPYTMQPRASFGINQSPDSKASNDTTRRGQNLTDLRARDLNAISQDANNIKRGEKQAEKDLTKAAQVSSFDVMLGSLDRLSKHPGLSRSVGVIGAFPTMPGSESANFKAELDTFQSQAFLPMVSQLKGMGALSDAEGKKLTAAVGALSPTMGEKAFRESVARITADMETARQRLAGGVKKQQGGASGGWSIQKVD